MILCLSCLATLTWPQRLGDNESHRHLFPERRDDAPGVARSRVDFVFISDHDEALRLKVATRKWECRFLTISPIWPTQFGVCGPPGGDNIPYAGGSKRVFFRGP